MELQQFQLDYVFSHRAGQVNSKPLQSWRKDGHNDGEHTRVRTATGVTSLSSQDSKDTYCERPGFLTLSSSPAA